MRAKRGFGRTHTASLRAPRTGPGRQIDLLEAETSESRARAFNVVSASPPPYLRTHLGGGAGYNRSLSHVTTLNLKYGHPGSRQVTGPLVSWDGAVCDRVHETRKRNAVNLLCSSAVGVLQW